MQLPAQLIRLSESLWLNSAKTNKHKCCDTQRERHLGHFVLSCAKQNTSGPPPQNHTDMGPLTLKSLPKSDLMYNLKYKTVYCSSYKKREFISNKMHLYLI